MSSATDSAFSTFLHEHPGKAGPDGQFRVAMTFPKPGVYHVFADAMPTGLGQQVVRFDVNVSAPAGATSSQPVSSPREGTDGPIPSSWTRPVCRRARKAC